jgi:DNA repair protein RadA/Sms
MKLQTIYQCSNCQATTTKWSGQCLECKSWNTLIEDVINVGKKDKISKTPRLLKIEKPSKLSEIKDENNKFSSGITEFDRVIGKGVLPGSVTLLSGEPGIGKSTLTLQIASNISKTKETLIVSGEESINQIASRAKRLKSNAENLGIINEFNLENILQIIKNSKAEFVIIDSIQVISSEDVESKAGSISQVRFCAEKLVEIAKTQKIAILLIGHVNKSGNLAGPRVLEHLVDTVMHLEGDRYQELRMLRCVKNRFGSCNEVGVFQMTENGMETVENPSKQFLKDRPKEAVGSIITPIIEGSRPFLVEIQALVSKTHFGYPKRTANGFDLNRLQIITAVLEKYAKLPLQDKDIFINVIGGLKTNEPAADLAVTAAILSSLYQKAIPTNFISFGEIGLSGEIRRVTHQEKRLKECSNLGLTNIISPKNCKHLQDLIAKFVSK